MTKLKTVNIKGKDYVEVHTRIKYFRENYPEGCIQTEILKDENGRCTMKAMVFDGDRLLATGHAFEDESAGYINKTSYIENCETSAIGRALGILGIGIEGSVASAEEVDMAIAKQETKTAPDSPAPPKTPSKAPESPSGATGTITILPLKPNDYEDIEDEIESMDYEKMLDIGIPFGKSDINGKTINDLTQEQVEHLVDLFEKNGTSDATNYRVMTAVKRRFKGPF